MIVPTIDNKFEWQFEIVCDSLENAEEKLKKHALTKYAAPGVYEGDFGPRETPKDLKALISQMQDGDTIWHFQTPNKTWEKLCGRSGYQLRRKGVSVCMATVCVN